MEIKMVKVHIYSNVMKVHTENAGTIYEVYEKNGKYGIDWNTNRLSYSGDGDVFAPFDSFAPSVIFEDVESGKMYHFDTTANSVIKVAP